MNAAGTVAGLELKLHAGGLWPEPTQLPDDMRRYIREADSRAAGISGQPYGKVYLDELLQDPELILDSRPTTAAILAAESIDPAAGPAMLRAIQHGHWEHGQHVVRPEVLKQLATGVGLNAAAFDKALTTVDADSHINRTRQLMGQIGARGFPAFLLERDGQGYAVPHQQFMSDPKGFADWLSAQIRPVLH